MIQRKLFIKGIVCYCVGMFFETAMDACSKWISTSYPMSQILFFRSLFALLPISLLIILSKDQWSSPGNIKLQILRAISSALVFVFFVYSLRTMPLVNSVTLFFTTPFFMLLLSTFIFKEKIHINQWLAIACGFLGAIIIINPSLTNFDLITLFPIAAAFCCALFIIFSKLLSSEATTIATVFYGTIIVIIISSFWLPFTWVTIKSSDLIVFVMIGIFGGLATFFITLSVNYASVSTIAPFEYTALIWSVIFGLIIWGDIPTLAVIVGLIIISLSGLSIIYQENKTYNVEKEEVTNS